MRTLTSTLLAAQKKAARIPAVSVRARNLSSGVVNLKWERLYSGTEEDGPHALTIPSGGALFRLRTTPASDGRKLYRQRITGPGPGADFSPWTYLNQYDVMATAACSLDGEVSLFWIKSNGEIDRQKSPDGGATWLSVDYPGYAPAGAGVTAAAAAYKPGGDLALFFTDASTLYLITLLGGVWQTRTQWDKTTGDLSGVAAFYDVDWKLLVSGKDSDGNFKVWSLVCGDGGEVAAGSWSALRTLATAPADGNFEYRGVFLDRPSAAGEYRCFFTEKYSGNEAGSRAFHSHTLPGTSYLENRWKEPAPFTDISAGGAALPACDNDCGLAIAHDAGYAWLSSPSGVWRASLAEETLDLSADVIAASLKLEAGNTGVPACGDLILELRNDKGRYAGIGQGLLCTLDTGCRIDFSPGYRTEAGNEHSEGLSFSLEGYEYVNRVKGTSACGAALILYASGGWEALDNWTARYQLRWNKDTDEASVEEVLAQVLARAGIRLEVISRSTAAGSFYPDFALQAGDRGKSAVARLLSFVSDCLFLEGDKAYLVDPLATDPAVYSYFGATGSAGIPPCGGPGHIILEGRYRKGAWKVNRVQVEGLDPADGMPVITDSCAPDEIQKSGDRLELVEDINIDTPARAHERGEARLRKTGIESITGMIRIPVNCGQQLYDAVEITDPQAGLSAAKRRVLGITLNYLPSKAVYEQKIMLGAL